MPETGSSIALIPVSFFDPASAREALARTVRLKEDEEVEYISIPEYSAVLVYSFSAGSAEEERLPEMYHLLKALPGIGEYNKIAASYDGTYLHLAIAQGGNLLLSNVFRAADFTPAEYFLFMAVKKLQMNPEVSSVFFRSPLAESEEMSLYRYFKAVEKL
jgi:hypothetical protein